MEKYNVPDVIKNYYSAYNAIANVGTMENLPKELEKLCLNATRELLKINRYINDKRDADQ